ncbi:MAG: hypothetical protein H6730_15530 [Deltaproteobacteria bacterium]|nr:hypothetical protein [Deltaproteobacteria bacterium]
MSRSERGLYALALVACAGCAGAQPEDTLAAYRDALQARDAARVHALSDPASQAELSPEALAERMAAAPPGPLAEVARVDALITLTDGRRVRLVRVPAGWRVAEGGLSLAAYDTPEAALRTLLAAAEAGRLDEVRRAMPEAFQARYASDEVLSAHLEAQAPRLAAVRAALGPLSPGRARIQGDRASIDYGEGRSVTLVREGERWRVLDVE